MPDTSQSLLERDEHREFIPELVMDDEGVPFPYFFEEDEPRFTPSSLREVSTSTH